MELTGPVRVELWAATDAPDTDFTAVLVDVHPDGRGVEPLRGCRAGPSQRHPDAAGRRRRLPLHRRSDRHSVVLPVGHRLRLHVSSSSFPEWEPNPNTGRPVGVDTDADLRPARQQVFHDARHPSQVVLPVIPRPGPQFFSRSLNEIPRSTLGSRGGRGCGRRRCCAGSGPSRRRSVVPGRTERPRPGSRGPRSRSPRRAATSRTRRRHVSVPADCSSVNVRSRPSR